LASSAASLAAEARPSDNGSPPPHVKSYRIELINRHLNLSACRSD
jgi:hypothetical protein